MKAKVQKWGNSLAVRIPKEFAAEAGMKNDSSVEMILAEGKIILSSYKRKKKYSLDELLAGITKKNLHDEIDFGKPHGKEIW